MNNEELRKLNKEDLVKYIEDNREEKLQLERCDLSSANLSRANLMSANLRWADLRSADFRGTFLRDADLREADLTGVDFRGAHLWGVRFDPYIEEIIKFTREEARRAYKNEIITFLSEEE